MSTTPFLNNHHQQWLAQQLSYRQQTIKHIVALQEHADYRKYYRIITQSDSIICMHAHAKFNIAPFLESSSTLSALGLPVAKVLAHCETQKLTLIEDCGNVSLLSLAKNRHPDYLFYYHRSIDALGTWQSATNSLENIACYDHHKALIDTQLCLTWFCQQWAGITLTQQQLKHWNDTLLFIKEHWQRMPQTVCHRDYHADNLLIYQNQVHIIDHQDLARGPIFYDIASLLGDHYFTHSQSIQNELLTYYLRQYHLEHSDLNRTQYYVVLFQRHLKNLGIFCRLHCRDNKSWYLQYLPRMLCTMDHCAEVIPAFKTITALLYQIYLDRLSLRSVA